MSIVKNWQGNEEKDIDKKYYLNMTNENELVFLLCNRGGNQFFALFYICDKRL